MNIQTNQIQKNQHNFNNFKNPIEKILTNNRYKYKHMITIRYIECTATSILKKFVKICEMSQISKHAYIYTWLYFKLRILLLDDCLYGRNM